MKTKYLLPNYFIKLGILLFILALFSDYYSERFSTLSNPKVDAAFAAKGKQYKTYFYKSDPEIKIKVRSADEFKYWYNINQQQQIRERFGRLNFLIFYLGCIFIVCSRLKIEDEYIAKLRLESVIWTMFFCGAILTIFRIYYEFNPQMVVHQQTVENVYIPNINIAYYVMIVFATFVLRFNYVVILKHKFASVKEGLSYEK